MKENPRIVFEKYRNLGDILSDGISFFRFNFKALLRVVLIYGMPLFLVLLISFLFISDQSSQIMGGDIIDNIENLGIATVVYYLVTICIYISLPSGILGLIQVYRKNEVVTDSAVWFHAKGIMPRIFIILLSYGFLLAILTTLVVLPALADLLFLAVILGLIVGIAVIYTYVPVSLLQFDFGFGFRGFGASIEYVQKISSGKWWTSFGKIILILIIGSFVSQIIVIPISVMQMLDLAGSVGDLENSRYGFYQKLIYLGSSIGTMLSACFVYPTLCLVYWSLVEQKEQTGLRKKIESIKLQQDSTNLDIEEDDFV